LGRFEVRAGVFRERGDEPNELRLERVLGKSHPLFVGLAALPTGFAREGKYYGKIVGWQYKVSDASSLGGVKTVPVKLMEVRLIVTRARRRPPRS
jgi:hypothetical protein